jgi:hypothetical protein
VDFRAFEVVFFRDDFFLVTIFRYPSRKK